jgi:oxygen-independent coproporphyrinogen-3 oxidase
MSGHPIPPSSDLAIYIHWPFCKSKCPYCDFNSHVRESVEQQRWKMALLRELDHMAARMPERTVGSIFFGGGTPSLMPPATVQALIERVYTRWKTSETLEITLEANPTSIETDSFVNFRNAGVNRVSLGVQSLDDAELAFLGREHKAAEALKAVERARATFDRYSFDLIYARPHQTLAAWEKELTQALAHIEGHMSLYQLTIEQNTAFHHAYAKGGFTLPDEADAAALYRLTEEVLKSRGLLAYEVSNYARPGEESRHNLAYWKGEDYIGVGPGAHGRLTIGGKRIATQTLKSPERWLENVEKNGHALEAWQPLEALQDIEERVMMGLRLAEGIDAQRFRQQTGSALEECIHPGKRALYEKQGLLVESAARLQTTFAGRLVLNRLTAELLS